MPEYIVKKPHVDGRERYKSGDVRTADKRKAKKLIEKGLLFPNYVTKEEKQAYTATSKAYINHTGGGWYEIKKEGNVISDKKYRKKEAIAKRDEINNA